MREKNLELFKITVATSQHRWVRSLREGGAWHPGSKQQAGRPEQASLTAYHVGGRAWKHQCFPVKSQKAQALNYNTQARAREAL